MSGVTAYLLEKAWVGGAVRDDVLVEIADGRFAAVEVVGPSVTLSGSATPDNVSDTRSTGDRTQRVPGLTLPGLANGHSHAFHRALRGRAQAGGGTFWTWREQMYDVAARLDPDRYFALARATFAEMVAAGYTSVGEFHYLHHHPDGTPYDDPNAMGHALVAAAEEAGIRLALLDTCYLAGGIDEPLAGTQRQFGDGDAEAWAQRVAAIDHDLVGVAVHSVRAVPRDQVPTVVAAAGDRPLHVHLSEQPAENERCVAAYGLTPTQLLDAAGALGPRTTAVHATHLTDEDIALLARSRTTTCFCPTTERDLADGIGPARQLVDAGVPLSLGSDSHAVIDGFEEMRALETDERLASGRRGRFAAAELLAAATAHASLGVPDAGEISPGQRADLVTVALDSPRTAGTGGDEHTAAYAATAADVTQVMVQGRLAFDGDSDRVGRELSDAVRSLWA